MGRRCLWLSGLLLCVFVGTALGKPGVVRTRDGRTIEGEIDDKGVDGVTITTKGGSISLSRLDVAGIDYAGNIKDLYLQRLRALPKDAGAKSHVDIARWLYENKELELARTELESALAIDANNSEAVALKQTVDYAILWKSKAAGGATVAGTPANAATGRPAGLSNTASAKAKRFLDADQINIIRQTELKDGDARISVRLDNNVVKRFVDYRSIDPKGFASLADAGKALAILHDGTPEMRADVRILRDPAAIFDYKRLISPLIMKGCASTNCHGGTRAGSLVLYTPDDNDPAVYTNFYILSRYGLDVGGARREGIDRVYPASSLIAQYGLPPEKAEFPHPQAQGFTPIFRGVDDPKFQTVVGWIGNGLVAIKPDYKIDLPLPTGVSPASQPVKPTGKAGQTKAAAQNPKPTPQPQPQPQKKPTPPADTNKNNQPDNQQQGQDATKEARDRMKPINPGSIPFAPSLLGL